jgi:hypothetical protein
VLRHGAFALVLLLISPALADQAAPVQTIPYPATTAGGNASGTISPGGSTFQLLFAATGPGVSGSGVSAPRKGCTIINNGSHTMYVTEGLGTVASTTALAVPVPAGGPYYCASPGNTVLTGEIDITGTNGEAFYAAQY